jgi:sugar porter (SP) family MFS transporter
MSARVLATPPGVSLAFRARVSSSASHSRAPLALVAGGSTSVGRVPAFPRARAPTPLLEGALSTPRRASARLGRRLAPARAASPLTGHPPSSDVDAVDPNLRALVLVVCLSMLAFGAATGAIAGALLFLERGTSLGHLTVASKSAVVAATPLGALVGAATLAPRVARARGRRFALLLADGLYLAAALAMATALTHQQLTLGRALAGVAVGVSTSLSALYISECAPARVRGRLSSLAPLAGTSGILLSYLASLALRDVVGGWRLMLALCAIPAAAQLALGRYLVESPRWLAERGRTSDARRALVALGQPEADPSTFVRTSDAATTSDVASSDWRVLWRPKYRRATTAAVGLNLLQQLCGINVVVYFAPAILSDAGFDRSASIALTAGVGALQIACGARLSAVIDRVGRRPAALWGIVGLGAGLACLAAGATAAGAGSAGSAGSAAAASASASASTSAFAAKWIAVVGILIYRLSFSCSLGPVPYVVAAEVFPNEVRATGAAAATAAQWGANAVVTGSFLSLIGALGPTRTWCAYLVVCVAAWFAVRAVLPETKGRSLESMGEEEERDHRGR